MIGLSLSLCVSPWLALLPPPPLPPFAPQEEQSSPSLDELRALYEKLQAAHAEDLEDLQFQIETLESELAAVRAETRRPAPRTVNAFNPGLTVFGNFLARADDRRAWVDDDPAESRVDDRFALREVELDFRASIDPWADGVVIAAFEAEAPGEYAAAIEEGYVLLKKLPVLDRAPAGLKLKVGRFRPEFGRFNHIHMHDLPQTGYPRALGAFLGPEGLVQDGISAQFFLPSPGEGQTLEAAVQLIDGGGLPLDPEGDAANLATVGRVKYFRDLSDTTNVEIGASSWIGDSDHVLYGADATYKWKPLAGGEWRSFLVGGEIFRADLAAPGFASSPLGYYVWSQYQLGRGLYAGVRYDRAEEPTDASLVTNTLGVYGTYYTSEFLRFRLGVEHTQSDIDLLDGRDSVFLELNFVFGSHPVEPYWVNR